jgi:hypothetical protein
MGELIELSDPADFGSNDTSFGSSLVELHNYVCELTHYSARVSSSFQAAQSQGQNLSKMTMRIPRVPP